MGWIIIFLLCLPFASPRLFMAIVFAIACLYVIFNLIAGNIAPTFFGLLIVLIIGGLTSEPY